MSTSTALKNGNGKTGVLFDFDGTLLDSVSYSYKGVCKVFERVSMSPPAFHEYCEAFRAPYTDFYRRAGITEVMASEGDIYEWYHEEARHEDADFFFDAVPTIVVMARQDIAIGIITAQRDAVVSRHLERVRLDPLIPFMISDCENKVPAIKRFCFDLGVDPNRTFFVGDFVSDMENAVEAGVRAIGITRGNPSSHCLKEAGAERCIETLAPLFDIIQSAEADEFAADVLYGKRLSPVQTV